MEERLLQLDAQNASQEDLNAIFRCAHSIKGGAGAFGLSAVAAFTHSLEAVLDLMRENQLIANPEVVDLLLKSRDVLVQLLVYAQEQQEPPDSLSSPMLSELKGLLQAFVKPSPDNSSTLTPESSVGWHIRFVPQAEIFLHGNDPLLILRELEKLGDCNIRTGISRLPALQLIDPGQCYLEWDITLYAPVNAAQVREAFEFVEDECELIITPIQAKTHETTAAAHDASPANLLPIAATTAAAYTSIRVDLDKVDRLINMVGELVITQSMLSAQTQKLASHQAAELSQGITELAQYTRELQDAAMAMRMQPVKSIFSRMPRLVRDLSAQLGKQIRLSVTGENTEVDKTIIEQLADPLTHMIRNSVDHGIEHPEQRRQVGKATEGIIGLTAEHRGGKIVIRVCDDGAGISRERVLSKATERGLVPQGKAMSDEEIDQLIFMPGFSTAVEITSVSGRGVGMDVVRRNIESIGGSVFIENNPGQGTCFTIQLPLTLAILEGMIVRVADERYIIPITHITESLRPTESALHKLTGGNQVINVRGRFIPVVPLKRLFGITAQSTQEQALIVLVEDGTLSIGLAVDELLGQQQVVIKSLEEHAPAIDGVSGATILGDGCVALIIDVPTLCRLAPSPHELQRQAA